MTVDIVSTVMVGTKLVRTYKILFNTHHKAETISLKHTRK